MMPIRIRYSLVSSARTLGDGKAYLFCREQKLRLVYRIQDAESFDVLEKFRIAKL
jgi:hypothetical protein